MGDEGRTWRMMGADGAFTLLLSTALVLVTAGLSWLLVTAYVLRLAVSTSNRITRADWLLVLGRQLMGSTVTLEYAARLNRAATLAKAQPQAKILVLGGHTSEGPFTEAAKGREFLLHRGISEQRIETEDRSRHTLENLQQARTHLGEHPGRLLLITSRSHLARSRVLANGLGVDAQLCAAEAEFEWTAGNIGRVLLEAAYLHWYWVGRAWASLTRNEKSLARIS